MNIKADNEHTTKNIPELLKYLTPDQVQQVKHFWTAQADLGTRQRWNVLAFLMIAAAPLILGVFSDDLGEKAQSIRPMAFCLAIVGTLLAGLVIMLNRALSSRLERGILAMNIRAGTRERVVGIGRAVKQVKFVPCGDWFLRRIRHWNGDV